MYLCVSIFTFFFFFKQKTAYEMRISDWSSDVCSSDLTKLDVLGNVVQKVDHLIIGGAMANTFLFAEGVDVGKSLCERDLKETALEIKIGRASCRERVCQYV